MLCFSVPVSVRKYLFSYHFFVNVATLRMNAPVTSEQEIELVDNPLFSLKETNLRAIHTVDSSWNCETFKQCA